MIVAIIGIKRENGIEVIEVEDDNAEIKINPSIIKEIININLSQGSDTKNPLS